MAAHEIFFDFYYRPKPSQIGQNGSAAAADIRLAGQKYTLGPVNDVTEGSTHGCFLEKLHIWFEFLAIIALW